MKSMLKEEARKSLSESNQIGYALNAMLFWMNIHEKWLWDTIRKILFQIVLIPIYSLLPKKYVRSLYRRYLDGQRQIRPIYEDEECGVLAINAIRSLWMVCIFYAVAIFLIFCKLILFPFLAHNLPLTISQIIVIIVFLSIVSAISIIFYKNGITDGNHLRYFEIFKKEDDEWRHKWKWITISFCLGSPISFILAALVCRYL